MFYQCQPTEPSTAHSGPDPLETIFVKIEKSLKYLQNASNWCTTPAQITKIAKLCMQKLHVTSYFYSHFYITQGRADWIFYNLGRFCEYLFNLSVKSLLLTESVRLRLLVDPHIHILTALT